LYLIAFDAVGLAKGGHLAYKKSCCSSFQPWIFGKPDSTKNWSLKQNLNMVISGSLLSELELSCIERNAVSSYVGTRYWR